MSDDKRRDDTGGYGTDFGDDFGTVEFADDDKAPSISFGDDTGPLPHWTEPPTAELPRTPQASAAEDDVWSTFSKPAVQPTAPPPQAAEPGSAFSTNPPTLRRERTATSPLARCGTSTTNPRC